MKRRPTIYDIAAKVGCHFSTVSLALRNHPKIPAVTRNKIKKAAKDLDYQPDPMLSALTAYRRAIHPSENLATIAWVTNHSTRNHWREWPRTMDHFQGATAQAKVRGYKLEEFWLREPGMTSDRASNILKTRNISGLLFPLQEESCSIDLHWNDFSAVTIGHSLIEPELHVVANHEYRTIAKLMAELARRGYSRYGLVESEKCEQRVDHNWLAAFLMEQRLQSEKNLVEPLILHKWDAKAFHSWLKKEKPDVVITKYGKILPHLNCLGIKVPEDLEVALHSIPEGLTEFSGMKQNSYLLGVMAVDFLVDMLHRNERGVPAIAQRLLIESTWVEGKTLRRRTKDRAPALIPA